MEELKFCRDCRHYKHPECQPAQCGSPRNEVDLVTGGVFWSVPHVSRDMEERCGQSGAWFEPWTQQEIDAKERKISEQREIELKRVDEIAASFAARANQMREHPPVHPSFWHRLFGG